LSRLSPETTLLCNTSQKIVLKLPHIKQETEETEATTLNIKGNFVSGSYLRPETAETNFESSLFVAKRWQAITETALVRGTMTAASWNILGLILVLVGVLLLFVFGMPFRVRTGGSAFYVTERTDEKEKRAERIYDILGWLGVTLVVLGTLSQIIANL
jgi:hypothetical protein